MKNKFIYCLLILSLFSCKKEVTFKANRAQIKLVDSLHKERFPDLKAQSDSICEDLRKTFFKQYVDSISAIRIEEIQNIIGQ